MSQYQFTTVWRIAARVCDVWATIIDVEDWPQWWRGVESVRKVRVGDADGVGSVYSQVWHGRLPYRLAFQVETLCVERESMLVGRAQGELDGQGIWRFSREGKLTRLSYEWTVSATRPWMARLAPVARPLFSWNHNVVMRWGADGLARRLDAQVRAHHARA